jgi:multidrug transporter EmrE-like cation transporter
MKAIYIASGLITMTAIVEAVALYFIRAGGVMNVSIASVLYAAGAVPLLSFATKYEGIGISNFLWNVMSTLIGFGIGIFMFKEKIRNLQIMGVLVSMLGVGMILLEPEAK